MPSVFSIDRPIDASAHIRRMIFLLRVAQCTTTANDRSASHISPHSAIVQGTRGLLFGPVRTFSTFRITSSPSPSTR